MPFANAYRKLRIKGTDFVWLDEGAYGVVFADRARQRIRKIYRARGDASLAHCTDVFAAETQAYEIASGSDELKTITPAFYGKCEQLTVIDGDGNDITSEFYPHLAFECEFIEGRFEKSNLASESERDRVCTLFWKHKIFHTIDMSVRLTDEKITKAIDFATKEIELWTT